MDFFIVYLSVAGAVLPDIGEDRRSSSSITPVSTLTATLTTFLVLMPGRSRRLCGQRRKLADAAIAALAGAYGNIGNMGRAWRSRPSVGAQAAVPVALIFCFETLLFFSLLPAVMAVARPVVQRRRVGSCLKWRTEDPAASVRSRDRARRVVWRFCMSSRRWRWIGCWRFLQNALRALRFEHARRGILPLRPFTRVPWEVPPLVLIKLVVHPALALLLLAAFGPFDPDWVKTAVLMAALPPALNVLGVTGAQYEAWAEPASGSVLLGTLARFRHARRR